MEYIREIHIIVDAVKIGDTDECRKELKEVFNIEPQDIVFDHNNKFVVIRVPNGFNDVGKDILVHELDDRDSFYLVHSDDDCLDESLSNSGFFFRDADLFNLYYKKWE